MSAIERIVYVEDIEILSVLSNTLGLLKSHILNRNNLLDEEMNSEFLSNAYKAIMKAIKDNYTDDVHDDEILYVLADVLNDMILELLPERIEVLKREGLITTTKKEHVENTMYR